MSSTTETTIATPLPEAPSKIESTWTSFVPMILIFAVFYFLLIRPQEKKRKEQENLITSVKKGEDVSTTGGIYGRVTKINESDATIMLEIADNVVIKIAKAAILDITSRKAQDNKATDNKKSTVETTVQDSTSTKKPSNKPSTKDLVKKKTEK